MESAASEQPVPVEELFSAIGEFFVAFSGLIAILEHLTAALIARDGDDGAYRRARIAVSGLTAQPLSDSFFAIMQEFESEDWSDTDRAILQQARREMDALIHQRNRVAHDIWHLGHPNLPRPDSESWHKIRTTRSQRSGLSVQFDVVTIESIRKLIDQARRIGANIRLLALAGIAGNGHRPEKNLVIVSRGAEKFVTSRSDAG